MTQAVVPLRSGRVIQKIGRRGLVLLPLTGLALLMFAGPAAAAGAPSPAVSDTHHTTSSPVTISGNVACGGSLYVSSPGGGNTSVGTVAKGKSGALHYSIDPTSSPNGDYSAMIRAYVKNPLGLCSNSMANSASVGFDLAVPANDPAGVAAQLSGPRQITVSWDTDSQFGDVDSYLVYDAPSSGLLARVPAGSYCSGTRCAFALAYQSTDSGARSYYVTALRSDGDGGFVESGHSATTSATLPPSPTTGPSGGPGPGGSGGNGAGGAGGGGAAGSGAGGGSGGSGGSGGGAGGSGSSGTAPIGAARGGRSFNASTGALNLPPAPPPAIRALGAPSPVIGPGPDGSFKSTLPYGARTEKELVKKNVASRALGQVADVVGGDRLARSLAAAFLLLLAAAHLRVWANRTAID